jgi:hypothetical protein
MANTQYTDVTKLHDRYEGGRHTCGHEYGKTTRINFGDHVRMGGVSHLPDEATTWSNVTL